MTDASPEIVSIPIKILFTYKVSFCFVATHSRWFKIGQSRCGGFIDTVWSMSSMTVQCWCHHLLLSVMSTDQSYGYRGKHVVLRNTVMSSVSICRIYFQTVPGEVSGWVAEWLVLRTSDHKIRGLNPARGGIQLMTVWRFIAQSFIIILPSS